MRTAEQVAAMVGPDNPGCDCLACQEVIAVKRLICDAVTAHDTASLTTYIDEGADYQPAAWLTVMLIAASRAAAQGFSPAGLVEIVVSGARSAHDLNPRLCLGQEALQ